MTVKVSVPYTPISEQVQQAVQWARETCDATFASLPSVKIELRFGFTSLQDDFFLDSDADTEIEDDDDDDHPTQTPTKKKKAKKPKTPDMVEPLTNGLWILPLHAPTHLHDFWQSLRHTFPEKERGGAVYKWMEKRDTCLQRATETAILVQCCSPAIQASVKRLAKERRMDLRHHEMVLIQWQLHTGLLAVNKTKQMELFLACAALHRIRVYQYDLLEVLYKYKEGKKPDNKLNTYLGVRKELLATVPRPNDSIKTLLKSLAENVRGITCYFEQTYTLWVHDERYILDIKELDTLVKLHDTAIRALSCILTPTFTIAS